MRAALARDGQQLPVVVVAAREGRYILIDGYKRVRALRRLRVDVVHAVCWDLPEHEALLLGRLMRNAKGDSALEQGWLLDELHTRFGLDADDLARRFGRSKSWVSRRLGLVRELPQPIQQLVRSGKLGAHAAMRSLVPLARANGKDAIELATAIAPLRPSTRQVETLCVAFARGDAEARRLLLEHPRAYLRAHTPEPSHSGGVGRSVTDRLVGDVYALAGIACRAGKRVEAGALDPLLPPERGQLRERLMRARQDVDRMIATIDKENTDD